MDKFAPSTMTPKRKAEAVLRALAYTAGDPCPRCGEWVVNTSARESASPYTIPGAMYRKGHRGRHYFRKLDESCGWCQALSDRCPICP